MSPYHDIMEAWCTLSTAPSSLRAMPSSLRTIREQIEEDQAQCDPRATEKGQGASGAVQPLLPEDLDTTDGPLATAQHEPPSVQQVATRRCSVRGRRGIQPDVVDVRPSLGEGTPGGRL